MQRDIYVGGLKFKHSGAVYDIFNRGVQVHGLSKWALKPDSLDPDPRSGFKVVLHELHTACTLRALHYWTGLDLTHCPGALSHSTARSSDPD